MKYPKFLTKHGKIALVAPSFGCTTEPYRTRLIAGIETLDNLGHPVIIGKNCFESVLPYRSNTCEACVEEFLTAYTSDVEILLSVGGGEMMYELLPHLDFQALAMMEPKWFMGYSDNTNFTFLMTILADIATIYGIHAPTFGMKPWEQSISDHYDLLCGRKISFFGYPKWEKDAKARVIEPNLTYQLTEEKKLVLEPKGTQFFEGRMIGGCLDILLLLVGTEHDKVKDFANKYAEDGIIWYLEACDMDPLHVKRAMIQLERAGWFTNIKGLIMGRPRLFQAEALGVNHYRAVMDLMVNYQIPVIMDADIGHLPPNIPIINGAYAKVSIVDQELKIDFELK